jgi:hypothetical protein
MYEMVADPQTRYSDTTITALAFAAWAEGRASGLERAQSHLMGVKHLIEGRGGINRLPTLVGYPILNPFTWLGVGTSAFADTLSLGSAIASFLGMMREMQHWQQQYLQAMVWSHLPKISNSQGQEHDLRRYMEARNFALGPLSALRPFLQVPFYDSAIRPQLRSHMALLWMLNKTLWELRGDHLLSSELLEELDRYITASDDVAQCLNSVVTDHSSVLEMQKLGLEKREPKLKATAVVHIFANCTRKIKWPPTRDTASTTKQLHDHDNPPMDRWYDTVPSTTKIGDEVISPIVRWFETVDAVELLHLLSEQRRQKVLDQLSAWLIGEDQAVQSSRPSNLSNAELKMIADEMRYAWMKAQRTTYGPKI